MRTRAAPLPVQWPYPQAQATEAVRSTGAWTAPFGSGPYALCPLRDFPLSNPGHLEEGAEGLHLIAERVDLLVVYEDLKM